MMYRSKKSFNEQLNTNFYSVTFKSIKNNMPIFNIYYNGTLVDTIDTSSITLPYNYNNIFRIESSTYYNSTSGIVYSTITLLNLDKYYIVGSFVNTVSSSGNVYNVYRMINNYYDGPTESTKEVQSKFSLRGNVNVLTISLEQK